jgi:tRNA threonylcarbamoyladenosine biosynthesis protein TsaE
MELHLPDEGSTLAAGRALAGTLGPPSIVKITGQIGSGKSTLVRGILDGYGIFSQSGSPTFNLVHEYDAEDFGILHCDFYRLAEGSDLKEWGGFEFFDENKLILVEWPERYLHWNEFSRKRLIDVHLEVVDHGRRLRSSIEIPRS